MEPDYAERQGRPDADFHGSGDERAGFPLPGQDHGRGEFTWPPVQAEAMYDPEARALSLPEKIVIEE